MDSYVGPALRSGGIAGATATSMDTSKWLGEMVTRGLDSAPDRNAALDYLSRAAEGVAAGPLSDEGDQATPTA